MRCSNVLVAITIFVGCADQQIDPKPVANQLREQVDKPMPSYPSPASWVHATKQQAGRAARSFKELAKRKVPVYDGPLMVDDDDEAKVQSAQDVARRTLVLWAVELKAEGMPQEEALKLIDGLDLWNSVSPDEKRFLHDDDPDAEESERLVWRLESLWVLLWALGYIDNLDWPEGMCDVRKVVDVLKKHESDPEFIRGARLRSTGELLDAQDLTMRIHWALRDAALHQDGMIPENLDWSNSEEMVPVTMSAAVGVVEQRHYVLNWLLRFLEPADWDSVDTPT